MFLKITFPQWNIVAYLECLFQCALKVSKKLNSKYIFTLKKILLLVFFSHSVLPDSLRPRGLQHSRFPCPSPPPGVYSNSCPLSWWCHWTIVSSVAPFSSWPAPGSFPLSQLFATGGQSTEASASVLPMNIHYWFPLGLTGLISLLSNGFWRVFSSLKAAILWCSVFIMLQLSHLWVTAGSTTALTIWALLTKWYICFLIHCLGLSQFFF